MQGAPAVMLSRIHFIIGSTVALTACATAPPADVIMSTTLRERLEGVPLSFNLDPALASAIIQVSVRHADKWDTEPLALDLTGGSVALSSQADGGLAVDRFDLSFSDIVIEGVEALPSGVLRLLDVRVALEAPSAAGELTWSETSDRLDAAIALDLVLDWSLESENGDQIPLGTQHLAGAELAVSVVDQPDDVDDAVVGLSISRPGELWSWADVVRLENATLVAQGAEGVPVE